MFRSHLNDEPLELFAGEEASPSDADSDAVLVTLAEGQLVGEVTVVSTTDSMTGLQSRADLRGRPGAVRCHETRQCHQQCPHKGPKDAHFDARYRERIRRVFTSRSAEKAIFCSGY